jgi:hypothetical protein
MALSPDITDQELIEQLATKVMGWNEQQSLDAWNFGKKAVCWFNPQTNKDTSR